MQLSSNCGSDPLLTSSSSAIQTAPGSAFPGTCRCSSKRGMTAAAGSIGAADQCEVSAPFLAPLYAPFVAPLVLFHPFFEPLLVLFHAFFEPFLVLW